MSSSTSSKVSTGGLGIAAMKMSRKTSAYATDLNRRRQIASPEIVKESHPEVSAVRKIGQRLFVSLSGPHCLGIMVAFSAGRSVALLVSYVKLSALLKQTPLKLMRVKIGRRRTTRLLRSPRLYCGFCQEA
ncbi:hypothetical protein SASPL_126095 [Salvia splendens]|uniref:Uncharacterized protein n=1 Tax=Salvia splendens TaxID=180675 RepID=A0A8X8XL67_SALSN|nr:hypothetical protein SASPL_126095 [Salvia splendens]